MRLTPSASQVPGMLRCSWCYYAKKAGIVDDHYSAAADTGTAVGRVLELWHRGKSYEDATGTARVEGVDVTPRADWDRVTKIARAYTTDYRHAREHVPPEYLERAVQLTLPAHPLDPTGDPIVISGRIDLVRRDTGRMELWDYKCTGRPGVTACADYYYQQAVYLAALRQEGVDCYPGGIIRLTDYLLKATKVPTDARLFYRYELTADQIYATLDLVALRVAELRRGEVYPVPGEYCGWCPMGGPNECIRRLTDG